MIITGWRRFLCRQLLGFGIASVALAAGSTADGANAAAVRTFLLKYDVTITGLDAARVARVWVPVPVTDADQTVDVVGRDVPATATVSDEPRFHNRMLYAEAKADGAGTLHMSLTYRVVRREAAASPDPDASHGTLAEYLGPDSRVPVGGKSLRLTRGVSLPSDPTDLARRLYDLVDDHMVYAKDRPGWGNGDSDWACESGRGNCTDFHSLFISLSRAYHVPAKFEIGFLLPRDQASGTVAGYHCWAKFRDADGKWVPLDISEANKHPDLRTYYFGHLTPDRVRLTTGRDIVLVPRQDGPPLNYFVDPYVEVGGAPYPANRVTTAVSFRNIVNADGH